MLKSRLGAAHNAIDRGHSVVHLPIRSSPPDRNESPSLLNYKVSMGDTYFQNHFPVSAWGTRDNRGVFHINRFLPMAGITDGTSNTVLLAEVAGGGAPRDLLGGVAQDMQAWDPASCQARVAWSMAVVS